jgi:prevent-host-death family protein
MPRKRSVSIHQLSERATEILREVRIKRATIVITSRGKVIAHLIPTRKPRTTSQQNSAIWTNLDRLAAEIGARWTNDVSAKDAVREGRREL